jgi:hypothetical protein
VFKVSQGTIERVINDLRSGASDEFEREYFKDDPEMLAFVTEQQAKRQTVRTDNEQEAVKA